MHPPRIFRDYQAVKLRVIPHADPPAASQNKPHTTHEPVSVQKRAANRCFSDEAQTSPFRPQKPKSAHLRSRSLPLKRQLWRHIPLRWGNRLLHMLSGKADPRRSPVRPHSRPSQNVWDTASPVLYLSGYCSSVPDAPKAARSPRCDQYVT